MNTVEIDRAIVRLIASGGARTKPALTQELELPRAIIAAHVNSLAHAGFLTHDATVALAGRGRPAVIYRLSREFGLVTTADVGVDRTLLAVADFDGRILAEGELMVDIGRGPTEILEEVGGRLAELIGGVEGHGMLRALVVSLPGPIDQERGRPVRPPIMPGWDEFPVAEFLEQKLGCLVIVENDANVRALGEAQALSLDQLPLMYITVGAGIGGGIVTADGSLHRGADGAAGDIGHIRVADDLVCVCGNVGCVEAVASASAILKQLSTDVDAGPPIQTLDELYEHLRLGHPPVVRAVRKGALEIGKIAAMLVHVVNPRRIVVDGPLSHASDDILAGIRSVVYQRALPLATRNLMITNSVLGESAGRSGGIAMGIAAALERFRARTDDEEQQ